MASDKKRNTPEYWEARLKRMGLDADKGRPSWLSYGHIVTEIDYDGRRTYTAQDVEDRQEWPLSI